MNREERKMAIAAARERKPVPGIYAVRCLATRQAWIGQANDIDAIENRVRFALQQRTHPRRSLQAMLKAHPADQFTWEALERLDPDLEGFDRQQGLRDRQAHWCEALGGEAV